MEYFDFKKETLNHYLEKSGTQYDSNDQAATWYYDVRKKLYYLVNLVGERLNKDFKVVYTERPNGQAGPGKIVFKEYILAGFSDYKTIGDNLFIKFEVSGFDNNQPQFAINIDINFRKGDSPFKERRKEIFKKDYHYWIIDDKFPKSWEELVDLIYPTLENVYKSYYHYINDLILSERITNELEMNRKLLQYKKQIILQGPPGTGKTRLAKEIAKVMINKNTPESVNLTNHEQFKIVQFHPSYTYEDFVRGIATIPNENGIEYQVIDRGIAEFANQALENYINSQKKGEEISYERAIVAGYEAFKLELESELNDDKKINLTKAVDIVDFDEDSFLYIGHVWQGQAHRMHHKDIVNAYLSGNRSRQDIKQNMSLSGSARQHASYYVVILQKFCDYIAQNPINITSNSIEKEELQNYVMVIDEINRANLSSVLGELIYALEYRGKGIEGMYSKTDSDKIILPPNLYIIGTMNTADRSVGHIDYAIRRRFAFVDVLPQDLSGDSMVTFDSELFNTVKKLFTIDEYMTRSQYLSNEFDPKEVALGHSYFIDKSDEGGAMAIRLEYEIKPILREYIKDGILIGDGIIEKVEALKVEELKENV